MPIYGYRCSECGHELEVLQSMSAEPLRACPECSGELRKLLYPVGVHFKGSGFYSTDYRSGGPASKTDADGSKDAPASSGSGSGESSAGTESSSTKKKAESAAAKE